MPAALNRLLGRSIRPRGRSAFLQCLGESPVVLDVGCGNRSPARTKRIRPDCVYIGLDVADYNQDSGSTALADQYLLCRPEEFVARLLGLGQSADAVISSHNIEHCLEPDAVLRAMCDALKPRGRLFLSFPCAASVSFPRRAGTLNYFDDPTHRDLPDLDRLLEILAQKKLTVEYVSRRYRPVPLFVLGLLLEPLSMIFERNMPLGSTWALYGFESVVWAAKS